MELAGKDWRLAELGFGADLMVFVWQVALAGSYEALGRAEPVVVPLVLLWGLEAEE